MGRFVSRVAVVTFAFLALSLSSGLAGVSFAAIVDPGGSTSGSSKSASGTACDPATDGACASCENGATTAKGCIPATQDPAAKPGTCTESGCDLIKSYLNPIVDLLAGLVGVVSVISLILGGIQYSTSGGEPQKTQAAKNRIAKTVWALLAFMFLYAFLQFLIPGGILNPGS